MNGRMDGWMDESTECDPQIITHTRECRKEGGIIYYGFETSAKFNSGFLLLKLEM